MSSPRSWPALYFGLLLIVSCSHAAPPPLLGREIRDSLEVTLPLEASEAFSQRRRVVEAARRFANGAPIVVDGLRFPTDPVGFVRAAFWSVGIDLFDANLAAEETADGAEIVYKTQASRGQLHTHTPRPADLLFLDAAKGDEHPYPIQAAVVEEILANGTILAVGAFAAGPGRITLNLRHPNQTHDERGVRLNDEIGSGTAVPAAQLFRSFADPFSG